MKIIGPKEDYHILNNNINIEVYIILYYVFQ